MESGSPYSVWMPLKAKHCRTKIGAVINEGMTLPPDMQQHYRQIIETMKELKTHHKVQSTFRLVTSEACVQKIDDKGERAF